MPEPVEGKGRWGCRCYRYPTLKGMQAVLDQLAEHFPEAAAASAGGMVDMRWVRQLEESGFIEALYQDGLGGPVR